MIAISLVFDRLWSQSRVNNVIAIRSWLRQALGRTVEECFIVAVSFGALNCHLPGRHSTTSRRSMARMSDSEASRRCVTVNRFSATSLSNYVSVRKKSHALIGRRYVISCRLNFVTYHPSWADILLFCCRQNTWSLFFSCSSIIVCVCCTHLIDLLYRLRCHHYVHIGHAAEAGFTFVSVCVCPRENGKTTDQKLV